MAPFGPWRRRPVSERAAIVRRAGELMADRRDQLASLVTLEMGKLGPSWRLSATRRTRPHAAPRSPDTGRGGSRRGRCCRG
ncbi:MAG TPA: aldehyde dehydrogenase family protein [Solirubrobacteraceae bacterium]